MAIAKKGLLKGVRGRLGEYVCYQLDNQTVVRTIGKSNKPPTVKQLGFRKSAILMKEFMHPVKSLVKIGFSSISTGNGNNAYNCAYAYNLRYAITGTYPNLKIDFGKVLFTKGDMPVCTNYDVLKTPVGLTFSWTSQENLPGTHWSDHAIMIAYVPSLNQSIHFFGGTRRHQHTDHLPLKHIKRGHLVETYLAFISDDHKNISDSVYTGQFFW